MRKRIFFTIVLSLCAVEFGAFAAAKQKSTSAGTKIATASENTMIPSACQDAFYGCMDAFCMLDNAAGGRCQCSDRITELDKALEDIVKLDEQTYLMATEGVELIQMGEAEDQVIARAKAAANKISVEDSNTNKTKKKTTRSLDLSAWNTVAFIDQDDDMFDDYESDTVSSLSGKQGDDLFSTSAKMCSSQLADNCRTYRSMLQMAYSQKVKSDCVAYENSLKIQKNQSQQKLQTAQKALRDAALDEYQNKNKYATVGECAVAFATCMQTTAGCGKDYTGCVTLAAQENVRNNKGGVKAKQTKIKGAVSGADVTLAAATMNQLLAKKPMCETVTKQCVNSNKNDAVWDTFLRNAAPALKSAELVAEQKLRSDCIPTAAECFKNACLSKFGEDEEGYDMCLSNPETYKSLCKVQLEPCLEATGGTYDNPTASSLWNGLVALLNSMKVDACTAQITKCLTDRCGEDYSECIGLDTASIVALCPKTKLVACMDKFSEDSVEEYVAQIAQGLAVKIDNSLAIACENAAKEAMVRVCGDSETCDAAQFNLSSLKTMIKPQACRYDNQEGTTKTCYSNVSQFGKSDNGYGIYATLVGKPAISSLTYGDNGKFAANATSYSTTEYSQETTDQVVSTLDSALDRIMNSIKSDPKVTYCIEGRSVQGFSGFDGIQNNGGRFTNLIDSMRGVVAEHLLSMVYEENSELEASFSDALEDLNKKIEERAKTIEEYGSALTKVELAKLEAEESKLDTQNSNRCTCDKTPHTKHDTMNTSCLTETDKWRYIKKIKDNGTWEYMTDAKNVGSKKTVTDVIGKYDSSKNVCELRTIKYQCKTWSASRCKEYDSGTVVATSYQSMSKTSINTAKKLTAK